MKKQFGSIVKLVISLGFGIGIIYWFMGQMSESDKQAVVQDIKRADYLWVCIPPIIGLISNYFRTERWRILLRPLGYNPGLINTFLSVMIMYFLNLFFPRLGEVSRCGVLARYENVPFDKSFGTVVQERLMDVICLGILTVILLVFEHDKFMELYNKIAKNSSDTFGEIIAKYQISAQVKWTIYLSVLMGIILFIGWQVRKTGWENIVEKGRERFVGLLRGVISIKDVKNPLAFLFHSLMIWVCYFSMGYFGFRMFPETASQGPMTAMVILFFSSIAFSLTPGGLGLSPLFTQIVLTLYGVVGSAAISYGLVTWTVQTISVLVMGAISLAILAIINREPSLKEVTLKT